MQVTKAKARLNQIHRRLDGMLRRNEIVFQEAIRRWFNFTVKQIQTDLRSKFQKDIISELTDWEFLEENGQKILKPASLKVMKSGGDAAYKILAMEGSFDVLNVRSVEAADKFCGKLVREVNGETKKGIRTFISTGIKEGKPMPKIAREIRPLVGLTKTQTDSVVNYRKLLEDKEKFPKLSAADIDRKVQRYSDKTHRRRALTIARTEIARAQNLGYVMGLEDLGVEKVEFSASVGACDICAAMDGKKYDVGRASGIIPVHPNCRCAMLPVVGEKTINKPLKKPPSEIPKVPAIAIPGRVVSTTDIASLPTKGTGKLSTSADKELIGRYTNRSYEEVVQAQLGKKLGPYHHFTTKGALEEASKVEKSLLKMNGWSGKSYRGMKFETVKEKQTFLKQFCNTNDVHKFKAFQSTSKDKEIAKFFMRGEPKTKSVLFEIAGKSGRDVSTLSWSGKQEAEILFMKGASFKVMKVVKNTVHLVEI